jgi:hypothetical protein
VVQATFRAVDQEQTRPSRRAHAITLPGKFAKTRPFEQEAGVIFLHFDAFRVSGLTGAIDGVFAGGTI